MGFHASPQMRAFKDGWESEPKAQKNAIKYAGQRRIELITGMLITPFHEGGN